MKNKKYIISAIIAFLIITIFAVMSDSSVKKVRFRNQNLVINQEDASFTNQELDISLSKSEIENKDIETGNKNFELRA